MRPGESPYCSQQSLPQMFCFIRKSQDPFPPVGKNRTKNPTRSAHSNQQGYSGVIINHEGHNSATNRESWGWREGDEKVDLDLGLDIVDGVAALDLERDGLPRQRLDEDLHLAGYTTRSGARVLRRLPSRRSRRSKARTERGSCGINKTMMMVEEAGGVAILHICTRGCSYSRRGPPRRVRAWRAFPLWWARGCGT